MSVALIKGSSQPLHETQNWSIDRSIGGIPLKGPIYCMTPEQKTENKSCSGSQIEERSLESFLSFLSPSCLVLCNKPSNKQIGRVSAWRGKQQQLCKHVHGQAHRSSLPFPLLFLTLLINFLSSSFHPTSFFYDALLNERVLSCPALFPSVSLPSPSQGS